MWVNNSLFCGSFTQVEVHVSDLLVCGLLSQILYGMFKCNENVVMSERRTKFCSVVEGSVLHHCSGSMWCFSSNDLCHVEVYGKIM